MTRGTTTTRAAAVLGALLLPPRAAAAAGGVLRGRRATARRDVGALLPAAPPAAPPAPAPAAPAALGRMDAGAATSPPPPPGPAVVRGTVYRDVNRDGARAPDGTEPGLPGAVVRLYDCATGVRVGYTRSDADGAYRFDVDAAVPAPAEDADADGADADDVPPLWCCYAQFDVPLGEKWAEATFGTPRNGETDDLLLRRGEELVGVDAGIIMDDTPRPTPSPTEEPWVAPHDEVLPWEGIDAMPVMPDLAEALIDLPLPSDAAVVPTPAEGDAAPPTGGPVADTREETATRPSGPATVDEEDGEDESAMPAMPVNEDQEPTRAEVRATVRLRLEGLQAAMDAAARRVFEGTCAAFLDAQLALATPPVANVRCALAGARRLRGDVAGAAAADEGGLTARVEVAGEVDERPAVQEMSEARFERLVVGTFDVQGHLFVAALKKAEAEGSTANATYYQALRQILGLSENVDNDLVTSSDDEEGGTVFTQSAIIAVAAGGGALLLGLLLLVARARKKRVGAKAAGSRDGAPPGPAKEGGKRTPAAGAGGTPPISPTDSASVAAGIPRVTSMRRAAAIVAPPQAWSSDRLRREVLAPAGKLGVLVANATAPAAADGRAVVHSVKPGSPVAGLLDAGDVIAAVNDVDTLGMTASEITRVMQDAAEEERKIVVLCAARYG